MATTTLEPVPAPALATLYTWVMVHWRSSLGAIGVLAEAAAQIAKAEHVGPSWLSYGHYFFLFLVMAGFISAADAKKVSDLEAALTAAKIAAAKTATKHADAAPDV